VSFAVADEHDIPELLDLDRAVAYRFGLNKWPDGWDPPVRFSFISFPPVRIVFWAGPFGFHLKSAQPCWIRSKTFYSFSRLFRINSN
jgi:hypothetical protein